MSIVLLFVFLHFVYYVNGNALIPAETTYYETVGLSQFDDYSSLEIYTYYTPPDTAELLWTFTANKTSPSCATRNVSIHLQHGSLPLVQETNNTFPDDFCISDRTEARSLSIPSNATLSHLTVHSPLAGNWYLTVFVQKRDSEAVGKLTDKQCRYKFQLNVSRFQVTGIHTISLGQMTPLFLQQQPVLRKFFIEKDVWQYTVTISNCTQGNTSLELCPLDVYLRGGALPNKSSPTIYANCLRQRGICTVNVTAPLIQLWHYLFIENLSDKKELQFLLTVRTQVCAPVLYKSRSIIKRSLSQMDPDGNINNDSGNHTSVVPSASLPTNHQDTNNSTSNGSVSENDTKVKFVPKPPEEHKEKETDVTNVCGYIPQLNRVENPDYTVRAGFTAGLGLAVDVFNLTEGHNVVARFDISETKDFGSTLTFLAELRADIWHGLNQSESNQTQQNVTVDICIQRWSIPFNGTGMLCHGDRHQLSVNASNYDNPVMARHYPYPEPGPWFVAMETHCYNSSTREPEKCHMPFTLVAFQLYTAGCKQGSCDNGGICKETMAGPCLFSFCKCIANYRGFTCGDGSDTSSKSVQLLGTLLLTISNLFFLPAIVLSTYRHYYTEAVVYLANMVFSTFYHACDEGPFSIYKLCILPYHTLQYSDFLLSILSFWVTLLVLAEVPHQWRSALEMLGAVVLAMVVEWQTHSLVVNLVPMAAGLVIVLISWMVKGVRRRGCYPRKRRWLCLSPGLVLAAVGLCIFGFLETDANYPYTHSAWHVCMSLTIVFFLPKNTIKVKEEASSDIFELNDSETVNLVTSINAADIDGDI